MDRGFGSFRGSNYGGVSRQTENRYDDFYSDSRRGGQGRNSSNINRIRNSGEWGGGNSRDRGFFNQGYGGRDRDNSVVGGQVLAAMQQQQNLLRAFMSSQSRGILPQPGGGNSFSQGRNYGNRGFGNRAGDKRKQEMRPSGFQNRYKKPKPPMKRRGPSSGSKSKSPVSEKKTAPSLKIEEEIVIPDEEVEVPDSLMDSVEKLRQRNEIQRNVADEDVQKLVVFCCNGKGYQCLTCGLLLTKEQLFVNHLESKNHVMNVIDARTAKKYQEIRDILDIDLSPDDWYEKNEKARAIILKQAKMLMKTEMDIKRREIENYNKNPANFFTVSKETMKAAVKKETTVVIKSIVETTMEVKEFGSGRHFGCEFIRAIASFHCRLCNFHISDEKDVLPHIETRMHKTNYQSHLRKTPDYEKIQDEQNKELVEALGEQENKYVLLCESTNAASQTFLGSIESQLVRIPKLYKEEPAQDQSGKQVNEADTDSNSKNEQEVKSEEVNEAAHEDSSDDHPGNEIEEGEVNDELEDEMEEGKEVVDEKNTETNNENVVEEEARTVDETLKSTPDQVKPSPKKSILKKSSGSTPNRNRGGASRRGRGRGKSTPSPRARAKKTEVAEAEDDAADTNDGNCMDAFQVVDEVEED